MTSLGRTLCVLVLGCGFAGSALGAMDSAGSSSDGNAQAAARISEKLRADLTRAGFTDVTVMPTSFLVRAKDSQGEPVMMVVNPDSLGASEPTKGTEHKDAPLSGAIKGAPNSAIPAPAPKP
jgi:hypothetical protein